MLQDLCEQMQGFYYHALRGSSAEALRDLGEHLGRRLGAVAPLALNRWDDAVDTVGGSPDHVGPTTLRVTSSETGATEPREIGVVVAAGDAGEPSGRTVYALGEAKVGEQITVRHVRRLEDARIALSTCTPHWGCPTLEISTAGLGAQGTMREIGVALVGAERASRSGAHSSESAALARWRRAARPEIGGTMSIYSRRDW